MINILIIGLLRIFVATPLLVMAIILFILLFSGDHKNMSLFFLGSLITAGSGIIIESICRKNSKSVRKEIPPKNIMPTEKLVQPKKVAFPKLQEQAKLLIQLYRDKIPVEALAEIMVIKEMIFSLLLYLEEMEISDYERHTAIKIITDYLPKTLMTYSELPKDFAANHKTNGKTAEDILMEQLVIMKEQIQAITDTMNNERLDDFLIQSEFLKSKFSEKL